VVCKGGETGAQHSLGLLLPGPGTGQARDLEGAAAKFKNTHQKGPHWADPLKAWGDVLAKQGHPNEALAKYDEALTYAPHWAGLKEARASVAKHAN